MYEIKVTGMTCGSCASSLTHVLKSIDPKVKVGVDIRTQTVTVQSEKDEKQIVALIDDAGYPVISSKKIG